MMKYCPCILAMLLCCLSTKAIETESAPITFSRISIHEGLSQSTVFSISQDRQGNMWFATFDGVNKYDGYTFAVYRHEFNDPNSLANDIARVIKTDDEGRVWIGTRAGLSLYDPDNNKFHNYTYRVNDEEAQVNCLEQVDEDLFFVGTDKGVALFNANEQQFSIVPANSGLQSVQAVCMLRIDQKLYIGARDGLYRYDLQNRQLVSLVPELKGKLIQAILRQNIHRLWIGTEGDGLYLYNKKTEALQHFRHDPADPKSISNNYIRSLAIDSQNRLWIGTFNELNIYIENNRLFKKYHHDPMDSRSLAQNSIRSIYHDSQGGMWLGSYFGGLNYYHPLKNRFHHIKHIPQQNSIHDNVISCIVEDKQRNIWIGTNDKGLDCFHFPTKTYHYTNLEAITGGAVSNNVKAVYVDEANDLLYVGVHAGGLCVLKRLPQGGTRLTAVYTPKNSNLADENIYAILPSTDGRRILLASLSGLIAFDPVTKTFTPIRNDKKGDRIRKPSRITNLLRDSQGRIWVGGENGLSVYREQGEALERQYAWEQDSLLTNAFVNCVYEQKAGSYWIGTRHGLYHLNEQARSIRRYTTEDGLPNNVIYGILEDTFGRLWMSTNRGLTCLTPSKGSFRNFNESDGLQSNQFNNYAYCKASSGDLLFGGINGITRFRPELLTDNPYTPPVVIKELKLFNKSVSPNDETGILEKDISRTQAITLKASQSAFSLEFVVSNYISGRHNTFAYYLEGYDKEWYYVTNRRTVSYSNLPHGTYLFKVKAANSDGKWNETPTTLKITILPVWYKTWWAVLLFLIAFGALVSFIIRYFWMQKSMEAELRLEQLEKDKQEEINQMKTRFFINIAHELRTPLTLILAPLQELLFRVSDKWTREQLRHIQRNANRLLHLVNQLMDYRRAELGVFELKAAKGDISRLVNDIFLFYDKLAKRKNISYSFNSEVGEKTYLFDSNYVELIVNNLLSNAFKYTNEGGNITVSVKDSESHLAIGISDTGIGIPKDKQSKIFERFYQVDGDHSGSGIGLSLVLRLVELHHGRITLDSEEGKGSTFTVFLPQNEDNYQPGEILSADHPEENERPQHAINTRDTYYLETEPPVVEDDAPEKENKKGNILIVEDNQEISQYLTEGLSHLYNVYHAENGEVALNILKGQPEIDVILTDVMMPVMDGIKFCKQVKQNIRTCHIPVIILSAKVDIKDQLEGFQVGADDYIPKPFTLSVLSAKVQNMIRTRRRIFERYSNDLTIEPEKITFNAMDEELLKRAIAVVEKNMDNITFSADEFAREMNMSRSNLHLKLKAITGESTIEFIRKIRFHEACRLLKEGRYTVSEISTKVGFNTPSYFATSFRKYIGCLPTEYVKNLRG